METNKNHLLKPVFKLTQHQNIQKNKRLLLRGGEAGCGSGNADGLNSGVILWGTTELVLSAEQIDEGHREEQGGGPIPWDLDPHRSCPVSADRVRGGASGASRAAAPAAHVSQNLVGFSSLRLLWFWLESSCLHCWLTDLTSRSGYAAQLVALRI